MISVNSPKAWVLAARPKTLTGALAPVFVGTSLACSDSFSPVVHSLHLFILLTLFALLMQIVANFVNDYYDWKHGADREDRLGPARACAQGWVTPRAMKTAIAATVAMACLSGIVLLLLTMMWELLIIGLLCVAGSFLYTTKFSYLGLGDVMVLLFFGLIPVGFTYYVMTDGGWTLTVTLAGIGMGLATDNLLMVNNYRDIEQDRISGKRTLVVRLGHQWGPPLYLMFGIMAYLLAVTVLLLSSHTTGIYVMTIYLVLHIYNYVCMTHCTGRALNSVLGKTASVIFLYGALFSISILSY